MAKTFLLIAFVLAALTVALGAFGAHGLESILTEKQLKTYETAARYQMYHSIALALTGLLLLYKPNNNFIWAGRLFITGIILFSGSLYLLVFMQAKALTQFNFFGAIAPLGGLSFIAGWLMLALGVRKL